MTDPNPAESATGPNLFTLNGQGLFVTLALSGIDGRPRLTYQDSSSSHSFTGEEITTEEISIGRVATVTTLGTVDTGFTTFSLVLPVVSATPGQHTVSTIGITTMHRTVLGAVGHGQLTSYHVTTLNGSAKTVES